MRGHFNSSGSPYRLDERSSRERFYRDQEEQRAEQDAVEKAARWIAGKMAGHQYDTLQALERSVLALVTTILGGEPDDAIAARVKQGCVLLWMGAIDMDTRYRRCVVRGEGGIRFEAA